MKKILIIGTLILGSFLKSAGQESLGINFEKKLSWTQILAKAKAEHKYVFVDCYATWCGPCKEMDANVYPLKNVGEAYNKSFVSVKVQMDHTSVDNEETQNWYYTASAFEVNYTVNAYPTFLFFDQNGKPVHKVSGTLNAVKFLQLAKDAQVPNKQYYGLLENFQPGKLDTAEEKRLARSFIFSDKDLGSKLAFDYLSRVPKIQIGLPDNRKLILQFKDNPLITDMAIKQINGWTKSDFTRKDNETFIAAMSSQPKVMEIAKKYIKALDKNKWMKDDNLLFIGRYNHETDIQQIASAYISDLPEEQLYSKIVLEFIAAFRQTTQDRGFLFFQAHADTIDKIVGTNFAEFDIISTIVKNEINPISEKLTSNKDWDNIELTLEQKYGRLGKLATRQRRLEYYWDQKNKDWSNFGIAYKLYYDQIGQLNVFSRNNGAFDIFLYVNDKDALDIALKVMEPIRNDSPQLTDTYANLLYKVGNKEEALKLEKKATEAAPKDKGILDAYEKMKQGLPTWNN